ncbi:MAG: hypothetical protein C5S46_05740 [Candidatus Methanomarinus sp.]|uniref:Uncharacterized protein n=1 Tax=Candidatus Methanomarinus sp. TaxID=3386244 RepID=A0AC61SA96_9EURY|nr:hypothetical protein C5S42_08535 [ANME-2 cluster archaeon]TKY91446.1 MAG: hypothetical protein C5S46_05740 [ANME-2 cluster archaeon]
MLFKEIAPMITLLTLIISVLIALKIKRSNISTIDGVFAIIGTILGLFITLINLAYSNNYLITLGPILTIASLLYVRYRNKLLTDNINLNLDKRILKIIQTIYWICISIALVSYYQAEPYYRPPIFFISISVAVSLLGLEILSRTYEENVQPYTIFTKILIVSLLIRLSAYFMSPYPIGSDPWEHAELIKDISIYGTSNFPLTHEYYSNYPLMHLYTSAAGLLGNLTIKEAMSVSSVVLTSSTLFIYLIAKKIMNNVQLALLAVLLINIADFHIQWSIQVIAMSFGIAIYTMAIYLLIERKEKLSSIYKIFLILCVFIIIWTHTISSFIFMTSLISLYVGSFIYEHIYGATDNTSEIIVTLTLCQISVVMLIYHWMDPDYPFFDSIIRGFIDSLLKEAEFLGRETILDEGDSWFSILNILGFLILIFFGVIGSLHSLSKEHQTKTKVSLIFMLIVLFFVFLVFPVMGIRDIVPYRWPAFIYIALILFSGLGIIQFASIYLNKYYKILFILVLMLTFSFFMITNFFTDIDSPVYGEQLNQKMVWTESEMKLFTNINNSYEGYIVSDRQTRIRLFQTHLKRVKSADYPTSLEGNLNWDYMNNNLVIWRKVSLTRPIQVGGYRNPMMLVGRNFKVHLDDEFSSVYDTGLAKAYLKIPVENWALS